MKKKKETERGADVSWYSGWSRSFNSRLLYGVGGVKEERMNICHIQILLRGLSVSTQYHNILSMNRLGKWLLIILQDYTGWFVVYYSVFNKYSVLLLFWKQRWLIKLSFVCRLPNYILEHVVL